MNSTTADGSSFNWKVYYGKDVQKVCFNEAAKVKHRFGKTASGHLMVIMKVRPARVVNEAVLNECLSHMGLTLLCTLEPGIWNIDERMVATRTLDPADKAASRPDWAVMKQLRRAQVPNDMKTTEKRQKARYRNDKSLVNVVEWEGTFGTEAPVGPRSVIIILPREERNYEVEKTYETARVVVFTNYRGDTPMHELVPQMAARMQDHWIASKASSPEEHAHNMATTEGMFNVCTWFGADMEPKEEDNEAAAESIFEVLAGARTLRPNPDPAPNPQPCGCGCVGVWVGGCVRPPARPRGFSDSVGY